MGRLRVSNYNSHDTGLVGQRLRRFKLGEQFSNLAWRRPIPFWFYLLITAAKSETKISNLG